VKDAFVSRHDKDGSMIINMLSGEQARRGSLRLITPDAKLTGCMFEADWQQ
jgi:hypothetical protein